MIVGERPPSSDFWYGWWYAGYGQAATGSVDMLLGARERNAAEADTQACPSGPYQFQAGQLDNFCDLFHFWSLHGAGANFLAADGSVHYLGYFGANVLPALATRMGGEAVAAPDW